jgi:YidC/Oxa1 family membrane protein insertase
MTDEAEKADAPAPDAPQKSEPTTDSDEHVGPQIDIRRLIIVILVCVGGLVYFFWDDVRDIVTPPDIVEQSIPADMLRPEHEVKVKAGPLDVTFSRIGAAVTGMTWTHPDGGHVEPLISQEEVPNRAFVISLPGSTTWSEGEFTDTRKLNEDGSVAELAFTKNSADDGLTLIKTFIFQKDTPYFTLKTQFRVNRADAPSVARLRQDGYTLHLSNAVGDPSETDEEDPLVSMRYTRFVGHKEVRRVSGEEEWPTEEERKRVGHGPVEGTPVLEWVSSATRYFTVIITPDEQLVGAKMTFTRSHESAAAVSLHVPAAHATPGSTDSFWIYAGPKDYEVLATLPAGRAVPGARQSDTGRQQDAVDYWYFGRPATLLLKLVYDKTAPNYGIAIIIVTIILRLLMWPVARWNLRAMVDLKVANARLEDVDSREPPRAQRERRAQWLKEARVWEDVQRKATIGAFLPMAILLPVLLVLYYTLSVGYEFYRQPLALWISDITEPDPIFLLPVLMGLAMMGQLRTMSENPQSERSWIIMPVAFTILFAFFSAGLVLFWFVDTLLGWLQLIIIKRRKPSGKSPVEKADERAAEIRAGRGSEGADPALQGAAAEGSDS